MNVWRLSANLLIPLAFLTVQIPTAFGLSAAVINFTNQDLRLTSQTGGVSFDTEANNKKAQTAWVAGSADSRFLVIDRNKNGQIDGSGEMIGATKAMSDLDLNKDKKIDQNDAVFSQLLLWRDRNSNGISETEELTVASDVIESISLKVSKKSQTDRHGNEISDSAPVKAVSGKSLYVATVKFVQKDTAAVALGAP